MQSLAAASTFVGAPLLALRTASSASSASTRGGSTVTCVATPSRPPSSNSARRSKVEHIKEQSDFLRHPLMQVGPAAVAAAAAACRRVRAKREWGCRQFAALACSLARRCHQQQWS